MVTKLEVLVEQLTENPSWLRPIVRGKVKTHFTLQKKGTIDLT